jgi:penicillin amidase
VAGQGDFIMPGDDTTYAWRGDIPDSENIVLHNPERGFVSSANQRAYRYFISLLPGTALSFVSCIRN